MPVILTVEDDVGIAQQNVRLLKQQDYEVYVALTTAGARSLFNWIKPDLIILDIQLPDGDGLSLCEEFRRETQAPILILTGMKETENKVTGLEAGGDYYLTKPYDKNEFLAVVQRLIKKEEQTRERIAGSAIIVKGSLAINMDERKAYIDGRDTGLTQKEFAILSLMVKSEGKQLTYEYLYENVWGEPMNDNPTALRKQISRIKKKLNESNAKDFAIFNEHGVGYTFTEM